MNKFHAFLDQVGASALAKELGVSEGAISHWRSGRHQMSPTRCRQIETISRGAITVHDLRPDVFGPTPREAA
jgi:DNA-binding transcriptional regulator YdaS (Cro superfamily)